MTGNFDSDQIHPTLLCCKDTSHCHRVWKLLYHQAQREGCLASALVSFGKENPLDNFVQYMAVLYSFPATGSKKASVQGDARRLYMPRQPRQPSQAVQSLEAFQYPKVSQSSSVCSVS